MAGFNSAWFIAVGIGIVLMALGCLVPQTRKKRFGHRLLLVGCVFLILGGLGIATNVYLPLTTDLTVSFGNKDLNNKTIDTQGRKDVVNGLVIPAFQVKSTKGVAVLGIRLYLSEGDARWDGPWQPTPSDEGDFSVEFYLDGFYVNRQETWNTPSFVAQRNKGIPWDHIIKARIKIYYGASAPVVKDFKLRNNS
jgi:multisubunit Na+/H+ antiporter MnhB subunit